MPEPCQFLFLESCLKQFLWTHKEVDRAPHPVSGLVLQGDAEKFPHALGFGSLYPFVRVSKLGPCFTFIKEDGVDKSFVQLKVACEAKGVVSTDLV